MFIFCFFEDIKSDLDNYSNNLAEILGMDKEEIKIHLTKNKLRTKKKNKERYYAKIIDPRIIGKMIDKLYQNKKDSKFSF